MLLATIIILFSIFTLGLLRLLDRYESAVGRVQADRHTRQPTRPVAFYDAFTARQPANAVRRHSSRAA